ncbi:MAG: ASCH domain-containing protein [Planctomycetota bacterium]
MSEPLDRGRIALGVRQPWAELIVRGVKTLEVRSRPTEQRGPIYIYAAKKWAEHDFADGVASRHGVDRDAVPYGRVVGEVEEVFDRPGDELQRDAHVKISPGNSAAAS